MDVVNQIAHHITDLDFKDNEELKKNFLGLQSGFIQVNGYTYPAKYKKFAERCYNFKVRPDDVWIVTYPRSGTTMTQELVWLVNNDFNFEKALEVPQGARFPYLELHPIIDDQFIEKTLNYLKDKNIEDPAVVEFLSTDFLDVIDKMPSPRFIKSHNPFSLLPKDLLTSGAKVVYVVRNPKDVAVSYYHHNKDFKNIEFIGGFEKYWELFQKGYVIYGPYFKYIKEAYDLRNSPNLLYLTYEDIVSDYASSIKQVCDFFGKSYTEENIKGLVDCLSIENFKINSSVNFEILKKNGILTGDFIRQGKSGGSKGYFTEEMDEKANKWIAENSQKYNLILRD